MILRSLRTTYTPGVCLAALMIVTACSSSTPRPSAHTPAIDLRQISEPVPRAEPLAEIGNHSPYRVHGKTYHVMATSAGYHERGIASWYGAKFHGRPTSTMETYDMYKFTAAHKSLPLPTYAEVTNLENGKSVTVRINDRGPFKDSRIIDLSYAAAVRLGMIQQGTARVEVRAINTGPEVFVAEQAPPEQLDQSPEEAAAQKMFLQIGAFSDLANAWTIVDQLHAAGLKGVRLHSDTSGEDMVHKVRIGPVEDESSVGHLEATVRQMGLDSPRAVFQ